MAIDRDKAIFVTGHRGLVGSAVVRHLAQQGFERILSATRDQLDLRDQRAVQAWFEANEPDYVIHVAGTVGGIKANKDRPVNFLYDNLMMHATVLRSAYETGVGKLLYLGSSCIYPRDCPQPIREEYLLTGQLEESNDAYAIAKISGLISCEAYRRQYNCSFISGMPTNLYGPNDNFDLESSHVLPALIRKFHEAKVRDEDSVVVWGTGKPMREFLHVDDLASACLHLMDHYDDASTINIGTGLDVTIAQLASTVARVVYPNAKIVYDASKPDGTPRKLLDVTRLHQAGWRHSIELQDGIQQTYAWFLQNIDNQETRLKDKRFASN